MRRLLAGAAAALLVVAFAAGVRVAAERAPVVARAAIAGTVVSQGLVRPGQSVAQGDPLVYVRTRTGAAATLAAVAPVGGEVARVLVKAGDAVAIGDGVAEIQPR